MPPQQDSASHTSLLLSKAHVLETGGRIGCHFVFPTGKWHLGLSCASRDDHCYHPLNHGFDYFYGLPFGLLNDCQTSKTAELHRWLRIKLWISTAVLGLVPLLLLIPKFAHWFSVPWKVIIAFALLAFVFFIVWYSSYGFTRRWNCILMRNHEIIQQPMREDRVGSLMLKEALAFIDRYGALCGPIPCMGILLVFQRSWFILGLQTFMCLCVIFSYTRISPADKTEHCISCKL